GAEGVPGERERARPRAAALDDPPAVGGDGSAPRAERRWLEDLPAGGHRTLVGPGMCSPTGDEEAAHGDHDRRHTSRHSTRPAWRIRDRAVRRGGVWGLWRAHG